MKILRLIILMALMLSLSVVPALASHSFAESYSFSGKHLPYLDSIKRSRNYYWDGYAWRTSYNYPNYGYKYGYPYATYGYNSRFYDYNYYPRVAFVGTTPFNNRFVSYNPVLIY